VVVAARVVHHVGDDVGQIRFEGHGDEVVHHFGVVVAVVAFRIGGADGVAGVALVVRSRQRGPLVGFAGFGHGAALQLGAHLDLTRRGQKLVEPAPVTGAQLAVDRLRFVEHEVQHRKPSLLAHLNQRDIFGIRCAPGRKLGHQAVEHRLGVHFFVQRLIRR
jgi:hypothetical protein